MLRRVALWAVSHQHERGRELATHTGEHTHDIRHPFDGSEVRDVDQDLVVGRRERTAAGAAARRVILGRRDEVGDDDDVAAGTPERAVGLFPQERDRKSTRLNSSHSQSSYAVFCLKKKKDKTTSKRDERQWTCTSA